MTPALYLASRSPRRRQLLEQIRIPYAAVDVEVDESCDGAEPARVHALRMAVNKAIQGREKTSMQAPLPVLAADTVVVLDDEILGKAADRAEAVAMLKRLSGRSHRVYSAVALLPADRGVRTELSISRVCFRPLSDAEVARYCDTGEPFGKAGGYAIQGLAATFIERLEGSFSGVMGLPLFETAKLLRTAGITLP